jgi:hypothetical protein
LVESTDYKYVITPSKKGKRNKRFVSGFLKEPGVLHAAAVLSPPRLQHAAAALAEPYPLPLIPTIYAPSPVGLGTLSAWYQQCQVVHPENNGQVERANAEILKGLKMMA